MAPRAVPGAREAPTTEWQSGGAIAGGLVLATTGAFSALAGGLAFDLADDCDAGPDCPSVGGLVASGVLLGLGGLSLVGGTVMIVWGLQPVPVQRVSIELAPTKASATISF